MKACASANFSWVSRSCDSNSTFWASSSRTRWISSSRVHSVRLMEAVSGDGIGEDLPKVAHQRIEVDVFHRHGKGRIAILARPSLCRSDPLPIGGLVEGTAKTIAFDKRLHQRDPMAILRLPIGRKPPQHTAQNPAAQSLNAHPGQNQKPLVVGEQRKISFAGLGVPADKAIARAALPRGRTKQQTRQHATPALGDQILQVLADATAVTQVVKLGQSGSKNLAPFPVPADLVHFQGPQFPERRSQRSAIQKLRSDSAGPHAVSRSLTPRRQGNPAGLREFHSAASSRESRHRLQSGCATTSWLICARSDGRSARPCTRMVCSAWHMSRVWQKKKPESSRKCRGDAQSEQEGSRLSSEPVAPRRGFQPMQQQTELFRS